jgi:hypothetical protein
MGSGPLIIHPDVVVFDEQPLLEIRVGRLYLYPLRDLSHVKQEFISCTVLSAFVAQERRVARASHQPLSRTAPFNTE